MVHNVFRKDCLRQTDIHSELEGLSKPLCNVNETSEVNEPLKQIMIELIPRYKSPEVLKPADGSLNFPPAFISSEGSPILSGSFFAIGFVRGDQFDASFVQTKS